MQGRYQEIGGRRTYIPPFVNERFDGPPYWACTFTSLLNGANVGWLGEKPATQREVRALARASGDVDLRGGSRSSHMVRAIGVRYGKDVRIEHRTPEQAVDRLKSGWAMVAAVTYGGLPKHHRRWSPRFTGGHRVVVLGWQNNHTRLLDPMANKGLDYAGEWIRWSDFEPAWWAGEQLWFHEGMYQPRPVVEPVAEPTPSVEPRPVVEPVAEPTPSVEPRPVVEPAAEPTPSVEPRPVVEPAAEPTPSVEPRPSVEPAAEPKPSVEPEPTVEPKPSVEPEPTVEPTTPLNAPGPWHVAAGTIVDFLSPAGLVLRRVRIEDASQAMFDKVVVLQPPQGSGDRPRILIRVASGRFHGYLVDAAGPGISVGPLQEL